jgi:hypothetical protein
MRELWGSDGGGKLTPGAKNEELSWGSEQGARRASFCKSSVGVSSETIRLFGCPDVVPDRPYWGHLLKTVDCASAGR